MMLQSTIRKFIQDRVELIQNNQFNELYDVACDELLSHSIGTLTRVFLEANIDPLLYTSSIPYSYLYGDSRITQLTIPDNIEFIDSSAFMNCTMLKSVVFGNSVSDIFYGAFENCIELTDVYLNEGLLEIGQYAFKNTNIDKIKLPKSLKNIDIQAFPEYVRLQVYKDTYAYSFAVTNGYTFEVID